MFLILAPIITSWVPHFNSLNVLTVIFLGTAFSNKSKWFLFLSCSLVVVLRVVIADPEEITHPTAFLTRLIVYLIVTYISSEGTKKYIETKKQKTELILTLAKSLDSRDTNVGNHSESVANYALMIAKEMKLPNEQCESVYIGGLLHDIGKIGITESILSKPMTLNENEYEIIKHHPILGYEIVKYVSSFKKSGILDMVLYHHERYDGKGYPYGLKGEEIPLSARIISIADSFDAMISKRAYKEDNDLDYAILEIIQNKGIQFDPKIAEIFLGILEKEASIFKKQPSLNDSAV
jgi:putative nucleotidyltransferase with HDIG domain